MSKIVLQDSWRFCKEFEPYCLVLKCLSENFFKKNNKWLCVHYQTRLFIFQVDYLDDINVETTYKLQNDTSSMNSNQSARGSGVSGARPKNTAAKLSGGTFQNSSASFRPLQNHPSPLLGRCSQSNPSPPSYRDALERECVEHPTGNNAYPIRNNEHLWLQRKRVNDDSVEFTVWLTWSPARRAGQPTSPVFLRQYWILCLTSVKIREPFSQKTERTWKQIDIMFSNALCNVTLETNPNLHHLE